MVGETIGWGYLKLMLLNGFFKVVLCGHESRSFVAPNAGLRWSLIEIGRNSKSGTAGKHVQTADFSTPGTDLYSRYHHNQIVL